jgi:hypothetical protein
MVIKQKDDVLPQLEALRRLRLRSLSKFQRERIEEEIYRIEKGAQGERQTAYHIEFELKKSKNLAVIHDLRIEYEGRVAQIDHLVIGRKFDIFLIETKNYSTALRISEGDQFQIKGKYGWKDIASPVEQSRRHQKVLDDLIRGAELAPKRFGLRIRPKYHQWLLVPPECHLPRHYPGVEFVKMDMFGKRFDDWVDTTSTPEMLSILKVVRSGTIMDFARSLVSYHRPAEPDVAARFGVESAVAPSIPANEGLPGSNAEVPCVSCGTALEPKVVSYCRANAKRFKGRFLCRSCQVNGVATTCEQCGIPVEQKVVTFCRLNNRRFGKRILCRLCQSTVGN